MYKIAVLGDYDSIYGFGAIGMDTFPVTDPEEGIKTLRVLAKSEYEIIYVTEGLAVQIDHEINKYKELDKKETEKEFEKLKQLSDEFLKQEENNELVEEANEEEEEIVIEPK